MADQNLKQIQFKRSSTENKAPGADIVARGEIALNTHGRTLAIYTKDENDKVVQLAGKGVPFLDTSGTLNVDGTTTLKDNVTVAPNKSISFETTDLSGEITRHIVGKCATNDGWYIGAGGTSNSGILEIGTIDDGVETIQFVQRGAGNAEARKLVLLDSTGSTTLPGDLRLTTNKTVKISNGSTLTLEMGVGANDAYIKNLRGSGVLQLTNDSNLTFRNYQVYYAMNGRGPGKGGTLLTNVENNRQAWQYTISASTATTSRWVKVATMKHPGMASSQLDLMISGGIDSGHGKHYVDFITLSGRNLTSWSPNNLDNWVEWRRVGSPSKTNVPEYYVVKNDAATDADASFDFYAKVPRYSNDLYVTVLNTSGYNGQNSGSVIIYETGQDTGATGPSGSILVSMKQIFDSYSKPDFGDTTGILPISRGGTGGTSAAAARNNLGLGTAAIRDVGEGTGNLLENGAYGLGGNGGKSINDITSNADMLNRLKAYGGTFWRGATKSGVSVQNGLYSHGSGIFMNAGDTMSAINIDYASAKVRVYAANNTSLAAGNVNYNELYGTANKPSKDDVGLGNLTNDAQVKKAGDTMSGDLTISKTSPGLFLNATNDTGNSVIWFRNRGNETGAIWAVPNTASSGEVRIRAKTTSGSTGGEFKFKSDGTFTSPGSIDITNGAFNGKTVNTEYANFNNTSSTTTEQTVSISGSQHTPLLLNRPTNSNLSIGFKLSGMNMKRLGIDVNGDIRFGEAENQTANPWLLTSDTIDRWIVNFGRDINVAGVVNSTGGFAGPAAAYDLADAKLDLNDLTLNRTSPGHVKVYSCPSMGGGDKITNKPSGVSGNFIVIVECLRKVSDTDYTNRQVLIGSDSKRSWERWLNVSGTTKSWTPWRIVVVSGNDDDVSFKSVTTTTGNLNSGNDLIVAKNARVNGNLGLSGASSTTYSNKGVIIGQGSALLETTDGRVIIGSSGAGRAVELRPGGPTQTNNGIKVTATAGSGGNTAIEYAQGVKIRSNADGALIISAKAGQSIYLRPQGDASSTNETRIDASGNVVINGNINNSGTISASGIITTGQAPTAANHVTRKDYVDGQINTRLPLAGGSMTGNITMSGTTQVINATAPTDNTHLANKAYVDTKLPLAGGTLTGNLTMGGTTQIVNSTAPTDNSHLTNKKYVDDKVASAISNAGDTYLPLAGGTVTGRLTITGDQLKTTSLWTTGDAAVNGGLTVDGKSRFNQEFSVSTSVNVQNDGNSHVFFRKADGTEKGLLWADGPGNVSIRAGGASGPVWNFWNSGSCQFPGAISSYNGISTTTNYPAGQPNGTYNNTAGLVTRFSNGAYASIYFQEYVGNYHQAILNVNGFGRDDNFFFRSGGDFFCTRNGSFDNVEIRSDRRAKSDIKVIENALEKVETLSGNTYELHNTSGGTTRSAGLIAQEVKEVLPEAVTQDTEEDGGMLRLNYNSVIALLVESVKELSAEVKELKAEIEELKSK